MPGILRWDLKSTAVQKMCIRDRTYTSESDVDIAVLLNGNLNESTEDRLADLVVDLNLKYDKTFSVLILI